MRIDENETAEITAHRGLTFATSGGMFLITGGRVTFAIKPQELVRLIDVGSRWLEQRRGNEF